MWEKMFQPESLCELWACSLASIWNNWLHYNSGKSEIIDLVIINHHSNCCSEATNTQRLRYYERGQNHDYEQLLQVMLPHWIEYQWTSKHFRIKQIQCNVGWRKVECHVACPTFIEYHWRMMPPFSAPLWLDLRSALCPIRAANELSLSFTVPGSYPYCTRKIVESSNKHN